MMMAKKINQEKITIIDKKVLHNFNLTGKPKGTYHIRLIHGDKTYNGRLLLNNVLFCQL